MSALWPKGEGIGLRSCVMSPGVLAGDCGFESRQGRLLLYFFF